MSSHGDGDIMVVTRSTVTDHYFNGFVEYEFQRSLNLGRALWLDRDEAEKNNGYKQIVPYIVVRDCRSRTIMAYKREVSGHEDRLHHRWSIGFGGHIKRATDDSGYWADVIRKGLMREFNEELNIEFKQPNTKPIDRMIEAGYLNDDRDEVGRVHLGVVYFLDLAPEEVKYASPREIKNPDNWGWLSSEWLFEHYNELEGWSQFVLPAAGWCVP